MSQKKEKDSHKSPRSLSARNPDPKGRDLYKPYDKAYRLPRQDLKYESPSQIIRLLSRFPRKQTSVPNTPPEQSASKVPSEPASPILPTIQPLIQKPKQLTDMELRQRETRFSQQDYEKALEKPKINVHFFQRKHRHDDDGDTLSEISERTTVSFSRFDRVFSDKTVKEHALSPSPTRVLETSLESRSIIQAAESSSIASSVSERQEVGSYFEPIPEEYISDESSIKFAEVETKSHSKLPSHDQESPLIEQDIQVQTDDADMGIDYGDDQDFMMETVSDTNVEEPRKKVVVQGDSFIRRRIQDPHLDLRPRIIPIDQVKKVFASKLDPDIQLKAKNFIKISSLFFDQMVDDLNCYKESQPNELQDEVTASDLILLMQRQRLINDTSSLESIAQKYLPREYWDFICQSAIAYNEIYPNSEQELQDIDDDE